MNDLIMLKVGALGDGDENYLSEIDTSDVTTAASHFLVTSITTPIEIQLQLYNIFIPILGVGIVIMNLAVVISSGLLLHKGNLY